MTTGILFCPDCPRAKGHCACGPKTDSDAGPVENPKESAGRGKTPLHLNPPIASRFQAFAHKDGADKYGPWNWREAGIFLTTYIGAAKRHIDAIERGEWIDPKSGVPHWAHVMAGAAISLDAWWHSRITDDRPPGQTNVLPCPGGADND